MPYRQKQHWGSLLWEFIHTITIIDFENNEPYNLSTKNILINIENCIPCCKCKHLYKDFLEKLENLDMSKPMVLFYWSIDLHNAVNKKHDKIEWTYDQSLEKWTNTI
jgi:hypothetical protein